MAAMLNPDAKICTMNNSLKVLIVEDSELDARLLIYELQQEGYNLSCERVDTQEAMANALEKQEWDLVISDYVLPKFSGLDALKLTHERGLDLPFLIVSGKIAEDEAVKAMKAGAHDYILKDNLIRLSSAIQRELREAVMRRERMQTEKALKEREEQYRLIVETANEGIWILDSENNTNFANQQLCEMFGYDQEEMRLNGFADFMEEEWRTDLQRNIDKQQKNIFEMKFRCKKGHGLWVLISTTPLFNEDGSFSGTLFMLTDINEYKLAEERLRYLSFHDILTGLYNRSYFEEELKRLDVARQLPISIIMADMNGLKLINDTLGHQEGDKLLIRAAKILKKACRKEDMVCRWGGDEFVILLPKAEEDITNMVCNRIRKNCDLTEMEHVPLSFAMGTATKKEVGQNFKLVFKEAEDIMYQNKLQDSKSTRFAMLTLFQKDSAGKHPAAPG
jgi:diguanylate cyclase (GGDEF)-like protein/PAS domain S-box-containing protein